MGMIVLATGIMGMPFRAGVLGSSISFSRGSACSHGSSSARRGRSAFRSDRHKSGHFNVLEVRLQTWVTSAHSAYVYVDAEGAFCCMAGILWQKAGAKTRLKANQMRFLS